MSKPWSDSTKRMVVAGIGLITLILIYATRQVLVPIILALILAYVLQPLVSLLVRVRIPRGLAIALIYLALLASLAAIPAFVGPSLFQQVMQLGVDQGAISRAIQNLLAQGDRQLEFFGYQVQMAAIYAQIQRPVEQFFSNLATSLFGLVRDAASLLMWLFFILVVSLYALLDMTRIGQYLDHLVPAPYQMEATKLRHDIGIIWNSFLRGQLLLCITIGFTVGVSMWALGMRNALALGLIAGILEVIPSIGPILAMLPAVAIAFFLGSGWLPLSNGWFALAVAGVYTLIQQVENHLLVPKIIGRSVHLHPVVVLSGAIIGAKIAGLVGIFLAAPTIATARVVGAYIYYKLLEPEELLPEAIASPADESKELSEG